MKLILLNWVIPASIQSEKFVLFLICNNIYPTEQVRERDLHVCHRYLYKCVYIYHVTAREKYTRGDKLALKEVPHKRGTLWVGSCLSWQNEGIIQTSIPPSLSITLCKEGSPVVRVTTGTELFLSSFTHYLASTFLSIC